MVSDQFDQEEDGIIEGIFPGNLDLSLISRFVAHHFAGVWDEYVPFNQWADDKALQDPDTPILIAEWKALKTEEREGQESGDCRTEEDHQHGRGDGDDHYGGNSNKTRGNYNKNRQTLGKDSLLQAPKCLFVSEHREELGGTPVLSRQRDICKMFPAPNSPSKGAAAGQAKRVETAKEKEITWLGSPNAQMTDVFDPDVFHGPPSVNRGSRHRRLMKVSQLTTQLDNQERIAADAIAAAVSLCTRQEEGLSGDTQPPELVLETTGNVTAPIPSPQSQSLSTINHLLSEMATLWQEAHERGNAVPLLEVTPSSSTVDSLLALSSVSTPAIRSAGRSALNTPKYLSILHRYLPGNDIVADNEGDMFSLLYRVTRGRANKFWFLQVSFELLPDQDSRTTLLLSLLSLLNILGSVIDGFKLHLLGPESTLPPLTLGAEVPKTAVLAFKYCNVKNRRMVRNSGQAPTKPQVEFQRHNDDEDFTPPTPVQGVIWVRGKENVKTVCNSIAWDMSFSGFSIWWKEHQSADSNAQVLLMCCPAVFDKQGIEEEIFFHLKAMEKDLIRKGSLPSALSTEPLPQIAVLWHQNKQGRGRNQAKQRLCLNNLEAFQWNGCLVCTVEAEEGSWKRLGPLWQRSHKTGICRQALGRKVLMVVMYNGRVTDGDRVMLQRLWQCNVVYSNKLDSIVVPNIITVHKCVEVRMEDTNRKPPHKFTDLGREFMMLADPTPSDSVAVVYAFDAIIPILTGPNSGGATLTYRRDNAYANVLVKKIKTSVAA